MIMQQAAPPSPGACRLLEPCRLAMGHTAPVGMMTAPCPLLLQGQIKQLLTGLMLSTPPLVRAQLSEALTLISGHDFPAAWPQLLPELKERLAGVCRGLGGACIRHSVPCEVLQGPCWASS